MAETVEGNRQCLQLVHGPTPTWDSKPQDVRHV